MGRNENDARLISPIDANKAMQMLIAGELTVADEQPTTEFTFNIDALTVADQLRGAVIIVGDKQFIVDKAKGFISDNIKNKIFDPAQTNQTGIITGSPYRNTTLANISTAGHGLVMPTQISEILGDSKIREIKGPGRVAKALGINNHDKFKITVEDPLAKVLKISPLNFTS